MNTQTIEKLALDTNYQEVVAVAKTLGITYIGVKKPVIIQAVNDKLDAIANGDVEAPVEQQEEVTPENEVVEGTENGEATPTPADKPASQPRATRTPAAPRAKGAKWYETTTPIYNAGDIVDIIAGPCLVGRQAEITRPSAKKDAMKCKLINPKDKTLQGTEITMDYAKIQLAVTADTTAPVVEDKEPVVNLEETSTETSNEENINEETSQEVTNEEATA